MTITLTPEHERIIEAQLAAGQIVPAEVVRQHLLDSIARLDAKKSLKAKKAGSRR